MKQVAFEAKRPSISQVPAFDVKNTFVEIQRVSSIAPVVADQNQNRRTAPASLAAAQSLIFDDDPGTPVVASAAPVPAITGMVTTASPALAPRRSSLSNVSSGVSSVIVTSPRMTKTTSTTSRGPVVVRSPAPAPGGTSDAHLSLPIGQRRRVSSAGSEMAMTTTRTGGQTGRRRFSFDVTTPDASCLYSLSSHAQHFHFGAAPVVAAGTAPAARIVSSTAAVAPPGATAVFPGSAAAAPGAPLPAGAYPPWPMPPGGFPMQMPPAYYPNMQFSGGAMYPASGAYPNYTANPVAAPGAKPRLELGALLPGQQMVHQQAPGGMVIAQQPALHVGEEQVTTVMLRNIPVKYNREMVLQDMDQRGFQGVYDFFYLPIDFQTGNTVGYAFINFINEAETNRFRSVYNGLQLSPDSAKICEVSDAKAQGKAKNVEQYRNSSVMAMEEKYHPVVFENGVRGPFPAPTRVLKPVKPRVKGQ